MTVEEGDPMSIMTFDQQQRWDDLSERYRRATKEVSRVAEVRQGLLSEVLLALLQKGKWGVVTRKDEDEWEELVVVPADAKAEREFVQLASSGLQLNHHDSFEVRVGKTTSIYARVDDGDLTLCFYGSRESGDETKTLNIDLDVVGYLRGLVANELGRLRVQKEMLTQEIKAVTREHAELEKQA